MRIPVRAPQRQHHPVRPCGEYTLWDQWEELLEGTARVFDIDEGAWTGEVVVPRETLLNWPLQSLQVWSEDAF